MGHDGQTEEARLDKVSLRCCSCCFPQANGRNSLVTSNTGQDVSKPFCRAFTRLMTPIECILHISSCQHAIFSAYYLP